MPAASFTDLFMTSLNYSMSSLFFLLSEILTEVARLQAQVQPITCPLLRIDLTIVPDFC